MPYRLPTEDEREMLFAWLKQASSLTAWRRAYAYHQAFVDVMRPPYEHSQKSTAPGEEELVSTEEFASLLTSHDAFLVALERLQKGDRRCFLFLWGSPGYFTEGVRRVEWCQDMFYGFYSGRNGFPLGASSFWSTVESVMSDCIAVCGEIYAVLQPRFLDVPAYVDNIDSFTGLETYLQPLKALGPNASKVPTIEPPVLVPTGATIPCYGIWEPVSAGKAPGFFGAFKGPVPLADGTYPVDGCMNYLHADSPAPTIDFPEDGQRNEGRRTTWRLLWKDERYGPNPIPEEEAHYVFRRPDGTPVISYPR